MLNRLTVSALLKSVILTTVVLRRGRLLAQRLGFLGPPAAGEPHLGDRRRLGEHVQGDAQSAHRPLHHQPAAELRRSRWTATSRNICAACATPKCRRWPTRLRCSPAMRIRAAEHAGARIRPPVQDADGAAEGILGAMSPSRRPRAVPRCRRNIWRRRQGAARHARQAVRHARRRRQPPGRRRSTSCWRSSRSPGCCATPPAKRR